VAGNSGLPNFIVQDFHFVVGSGFCGFYSGEDLIHISSHHGPSRITQNHNGDNSLREVLLKADVFVGCKKQVKSGFLRRFQQFTIGQSIPTKVLCLPNRVAL
jgi:hypothetical protein